MPTFGRTTIGGKTDFPPGANFKDTGLYELTEPGEVYELQAFLRGNNQPIKAVIYTDDGGIPNELVAVSDEVIVNNTPFTGWISFPFNPRVVLPAGFYWIGLHYENFFVDYFYDDDASQTDSFFDEGDDYADGPDDPWLDGSFGPDFGVSFFASYDANVRTPSPVLATWTVPTPSTPNAPIGEVASVAWSVQDPLLDVSSVPEPVEVEYMVLDPGGSFSPGFPTVMSPSPLLMVLGTPAPTALVVSGGVEVGVLPLIVNYVVWPPQVGFDRVLIPDPLVLLLAAWPAGGSFTEGPPVEPPEEPEIDPIDEVTTPWGECDPDVSSPWPGACG